MGHWDKSVQKIRKIFHGRHNSQPDSGAVELGIKPVADPRSLPTSPGVPSLLSRRRTHTNTTQGTGTFRPDTIDIVAGDEIAKSTVVQLDGPESQFPDMSQLPGQGLQECEHKNVLPETESGYFVTKEDLKGCLQREFGDSWDFEVNHSNYRWKFKTPRPLEEVS